MTGIDVLIASVAALPRREAAKRKTLHLRAKRGRRVCQGRSQRFVAYVYEVDSLMPPVEIAFSDLSKAERHEIRGLSEPPESEVDP